MTILAGCNHCGHVRKNERGAAPKLTRRGNPGICPFCARDLEWVDLSTAKELVRERHTAERFRAAAVTTSAETLDPDEPDTTGDLQAA